MLQGFLTVLPKVKIRVACPYSASKHVKKPRTSLSGRHEMREAGRDAALRCHALAWCLSRPKGYLPYVGLAALLALGSAEPLIQGSKDPHVGHDGVVNRYKKMNGHEYPLTRRVRWALFCANAPLGTPRSGRPSSQRYAVSWCCRSDGPLVSRPALSAFHWRKRQCGPTGRLGSKDGDAECRSRFAGDPDPLTVPVTIRTEYGGTQG